MTEAPVPLAEHPTCEHGTPLQHVCVPCLDQYGSNRRMPFEQAAHQDTLRLWQEAKAKHERAMAEMEAAYQNCAELAMTYHGRLGRAMAVVEAARRARKSMRLLIQELSEPGTEALAAEWELGHVLAALDDAASAAGDAG